VGFGEGDSVGVDIVGADSDDAEDVTTGVDARVLSGVGVLLRPGSSGARIGFPLRIDTMRYSSYEC
jgi:hypothetical protein